MAITMLEVMIWSDPFPKEIYRFPWNIADSIAKGKRPETIQQVTPGMRRIIECSWCQEAKERLTVEDIDALLETEILKHK